MAEANKSTVIMFHPWYDDEIRLLSISPSTLDSAPRRGGTIRSYSHHADLGSANTDTVLGWLVDPIGPYYGFASGNCCTTAVGSAVGSDPNGTLWARAWFR